MLEEEKKKMILEYLKTELKLNEKRCLDEYKGLQQHPDIENEFIEFIRDGWNEKGMMVKNYSAKTLFDNYNLSPLGAYNYLIYLREEPEEAIACLKKGLPRR